MSAVDGQLLYSHSSWHGLWLRRGKGMDWNITLTDSGGDASCHTWNNLIHGLVKYNNKQRNN